MIDEHNLSNGNNAITHISKYAQYYHIDPKSQDPDDPVGKPLVHKSAIEQTTGNKLFINKYFTTSKNQILVPTIK